MTLKKALGCLGVMAAALVLLLGGLFLYVDRLFQPSLTELSRSRSPDGALDAVLIETNGGATTPYGIVVFIKPAGRPVMTPNLFHQWDKTIVFSGDHHTPVRVQWLSDETLSVSVHEARIYQRDERATVFDGKQRRTVTIRYAIDIPHVV